MFAKGASMALSGALSKGVHGVVAKSIGQRNVADLSTKAEKKLDKATHKAMKADYKAADGKGLMVAALQGKAKPESLKAAMDERKAKASAQAEGRAALKASTRKKFQAYGEGQQ